MVIISSEAPDSLTGISIEAEEISSTTVKTELVNVISGVIDSFLHEFIINNCIMTIRKNFNLFFIRTIL